MEYLMLRFMMFVVHKNYQRSGKAKILLEDIIDQLEDVSCIQLIATTGNEPLKLACH